MDVEEPLGVKVNQNNSELHLSCSRNLFGFVFGLKPHSQSRYQFGSLALFGGDRRVDILEIDRD